MPAPPHDDSGHTWHHADDVLFGIVKIGVNPPYGPPGYQSDMPAFGDTLTDPQIWDVLAYIKSRWSPRMQTPRYRSKCSESVASELRVRERGAQTTDLNSK